MYVCDRITSKRLRQIGYFFFFVFVNVRTRFCIKVFWSSCGNSKTHTGKSQRYELSDGSLDAHIPSYPGSPRSLDIGSTTSVVSVVRDKEQQHVVDFFHTNSEFLEAAETGNDYLLNILIRKGTYVHQVDQIGRNALHLAVSSGNVHAVTLLLEAGVNPNVKDNVGMTPLSLCLLRRASLELTKLLFKHGAVLVPRQNPMDTGLFLQFVMMCEPTKEDELIIDLLVEKGAEVNDPEAPGGRQALHFAAMSDNCSLIEILLRHGADLYMTNHRGETPKDVASLFKCKNSEQFLSDLEENF